jgi:hypothetical protein
MMSDMKTISLAVSEADYERFREAAKAENRPIAQLIREAMALYREQKLEAASPLTSLPVLAGHRPVQALPTRDEVYDEVFAEGVFAERDARA